MRLQDWEHLLGSLSHMLRHRVPEPGHSADGVPVGVETRIRQVLVEPVVDVQVKGLLLDGEPPGPPQVIHRDEYSDLNTEPSPVARLNSHIALLIAHATMITGPHRHRLPISGAEEDAHGPRRLTMKSRVDTEGCCQEAARPCRRAKRRAQHGSGTAPRRAAGCIG